MYAHLYIELLLIRKRERNIKSFPESLKEVQAWQMFFPGLRWNMIRAGRENGKINPRGRNLGKHKITLARIATLVVYSFPFNW